MFNLLVLSLVSEYAFKFSFFLSFLLMEKMQRLLCSQISTKDTRNVKHTELPVQKERCMTFFFIQSRDGKKPDDHYTICMWETIPSSDPYNVTYSVLLWPFLKLYCAQGIGLLLPWIFFLNSVVLNIPK